MVDHLADLESDFSVLHRVDDPLDLPGPEFFRKAYRLPAYAGVMQARLRAEHERDNPSPGPGAGSNQTPRSVPLEDLMADHPDLIERG